MQEEWLFEDDFHPDNERFLRSYIQTINEHKRSEYKIHHMAYHDALTNLPNRLLLREKAKLFYHYAQNNGESVAVLFLDLDRFKIINDTLGHHIGDKLLIRFSQKLRSHLREKDVISRFSGDEFIILLPNIEHVDEAAAIARSIIDLLREPFMNDEQELYLSASIGISFFPSDGLDMDTLIKHADISMYRAKQKGGNTFQIYHSEMNNRSMEKLKIEGFLRKALERKEITIHYQPLVNLNTGQIFGMESLVRWNHPQLGLISPADFIPLAEETGLIVPIGNWVLLESCKQNQRLRQLGYPNLCVSVNISAIQFQQPGLVKTVEDTLLETGLEPQQLCLEITENIAMMNVTYILDTMSKLRAIGVQISIDDFGTGYSSLSYLKRFRVHTLKIDQSFIRDVTTDENNAAIVTALVAMSQRLKIKSLAEGVETQEQLDFLTECGCDEIQGFVFSTPLTADAFEQLLAEKRSLFK